MSKDILVDVDIVQGHPDRINKLIERIIKEIEAVRKEGYELYTITMQKQQECSNQLDDLSNLYRKSESESYFSYQSGTDNVPRALEMKKEQCYRDAQEEDFYSDDLKKQYNSIESRMSRLNRSKETLDNISDQVVSISKTIEDIKQKSEYWNRIFTVTINGLIDLNNRG